VLLCFVTTVAPACLTTEEEARKEVRPTSRPGAKAEQELDSDKATKTPIIDEKRNMFQWTFFE
jgi:hypothetical protein